MNIVVALDSFKGCMTSSEANEAVRKELENRHDDVKCQVFSVSDGGEGFLQAMQPDDIFTCCVHDAMMRPTQAQWGVKNSFAIIEVAQAIGLDKIEPDLRNPLLATSYGVGEMMMDALSKGFRNFIVGLGGSAVSDCGLGLMKCLKTMSVARDNGSMVNIDDLSWLRELTVILASDVDNPLLGPHGAAAVFAPQKGASADMIRKLERRASTFSRMATQHMGHDMSNKRGAGAAGGLGYAFMQFMNASVESGGELVIRMSGMDDAIKKADLVITGEGSADAQTLMGKLPSVVLRHAQAAHVPVILFTGCVQNEEALVAAGFSKVININKDYAVTDDMLLKETALARLARAAAKLV